MASFKEAFAKARRELGPGKTFTWNGKKYTTNYKEEEKRGTSRSSSAPKTSKRPKDLASEKSGPKSRPTRAKTARTAKAKTDRGRENDLGKPSAVRSSTSKQYSKERRKQLTQERKAKRKGKPYSETEKTARKISARKGAERTEAIKSASKAVFDSRKKRAKGIGLRRSQYEGGALSAAPVKAGASKPPSSKRGDRSRRRGGNR